MSSDLKIAIEREDTGEKEYGGEIITESNAKGSNFTKYQR